jgi:hypothetical protein
VRGRSKKSAKQRDKYEETKKNSKGKDKLNQSRNNRERS